MNVTLSKQYMDQRMEALKMGVASLGCFLFFAFLGIVMVRHMADAGYSVPEKISLTLMAVSNVFFLITTWASFKRARHYNEASRTWGIIEKEFGTDVSDHS